MTVLQRGLVVVGAVVMVMALPASEKIEFHRVVYNQPGSDIPVSNWKLNREFVVLHNTGSRTDRLLENPEPRRGTGTTLPDGLRPVLSGTSACTRAAVATTATTCSGAAGWYIWNNTGDRATLKNALGTVIRPLQVRRTALWRDELLAAPTDRLDGPGVPPGGH